SWNQQPGAYRFDGRDEYLRAQQPETAALLGLHGKIVRAIQPFASPRVCARSVRSLRRAPAAPLIFPPQTLRQIVLNCSCVRILAPSAIRLTSSSEKPIHQGGTRCPQRVGNQAREAQLL